MSNEDKMREEHWRQWGIAGMPKDKIRLAEETWKAASEACAAIKDAEIAEQHELWKDLRNVLECTQKEVASRDLMIKELRKSMELACVGACNCLTKTPDYRYHKSACTYGILQQALAKSEHHDSRALDKMLLEARIDGAEEYRLLDEFKAKLAELNEE